MKWNDKNGDSHSITLDIPAAKRLRDECDFDLIACLTDPSKSEGLFQQIVADVTLPVQLLAVIEDTDNPEAFGKLFDGGAMIAASNALTEAIISFFQDPQKTILRKLHEKTMGIADEVVSKAMSEATAAIDDPSFTTAVRELLTAGSGSTESSVS